jgi:hypothetical protein
LGRINKSMDSHNSCRKKKNSRHTKKNSSILFQIHAQAQQPSHTHTRSICCNNCRFPPFKTKVRNQHASSGDQDRMFDNRLEFDQEQFFGTDETFLKNSGGESARAHVRVCVSVCMRSLRYYVSSLFHATCIFHSSVDSTFSIWIFSGFFFSFAYRLLSDGCGRSMQIASALSTHQAVSGQK